MNLRREEDTIYIVLVFMFQGPCKHVSETGWLKTTEICCLTVLEAESPISRCWQIHAPLKFVVESCHPYSQLLAVCSQCLAVRGQQRVTSVSALVITWPPAVSLSAHGKLLRTLVLLISSLVYSSMTASQPLTSAMTLFPYKVTF